MKFSAVPASMLTMNPNARRRRTQRRPQAARQMARRKLLSALRRESQAMWARLEATGTPAPPRLFPLVVELFETGVAAMQDAYRRGTARRSFSFNDISFPIATTNLGRLKVLDPETREVLIQGGPGDLC